MKRKFTFLIAAAVMLLTMMTTTGTMWGQTNSSVTMAYSGTTTTNMTGNNDAALVGLTATDWSVVGAKGGNSNFPGLNKAGDIRLYYHDNGSNTVTVTALNSSYTITDIEITYTGTAYNNGKVYVGGNEVSGTNGAFDINATSFVVTNGNNSNVQVRISSIVINYSISGTPTCAAPTFSPAEGIYYETQNVTITSATDGATIYYTLNGNDPTTSSSVYSSAISITETTTVKAMAVKADYNNSEIASATYTINEPSGETWSLVTSASDLTSGGTYVIACNTQNMVAGDISNSVMQNESATFSPDKSHITVLSDDAVRLTLGLDGSNYTFANSSNKLLGCTAVKKLAWDSGTTTWSISFANNKMTMSSTGDGYGDMKYNSSSPRFTTYASGQTDIQLYRLEGGTITYSVTYNGNGNTGGTVPTDGTAYESDDVVTVLDNTGNLVKAGYVWAGWCMNAEGTGTVYGPDYTTTFEISANTTLYAKWEAKTITGLTYEGTPTGPQYAGQAFNPEGLTVTATFNDASQEDVTSQVVWTPNELSIATTSVTGTYMELTVVVEGITVTYAPGTENNPYTVAQAIAATPASGTSANVYIHGIVSAFFGTNTSIMGDGSNYRYYISDDGTTTNQLLVYKGKGLNNEAFSSANDLLIGDEITLFGGLTIYQNAPEVAANNYIVSLERPVQDVATPTFSVAAGTYASAQEVEISCETDGATIYYTLDGTEPTNASTPYNGALNIETTTTVKAIAYKNTANSYVATATYHICSAETPYTVAQALAFNEYPTSTIWVHGIVSTAPTAAPNSDGQLTYYISDNGEATNQLQVYKGKGLNNAAFTDQDDIQVGDIVTITGTVKIYNTTTEFDAGNYLTSFERPTPTVPTITVNPATVNATAAETEGTLLVTYTAIETDLGVEIHWFETSTSTEPLSAAPEWIDADFSTTSIETIDYVIEANTGEARTAYFKVYGLDSETNYVYSELVTINQAEYVAPTYTVTYNANGGTGTMTDPNSPYTENTEVTLLENTFGAPEGKFWDSWLVKDANQTTIEVNEGKFNMPASNVTVTAQWIDNPIVPTYEWVLTALEDITSSDVFVIIGNNGSTYAMTNDNGTVSAPATSSVTIANNKLSDAPADNLKWNVEVTTNGYTFYPNGITNKWLYCTDTNNGLRVGTGDKKVFGYEEVTTTNKEGYYLTITPASDKRYVCIYNNADWRSYKSGSIVKTDTKFYKRQEASTDPQLYTDDVNIESDATEGAITYTLENPVSGGELTAEITAGNEGGWLTLGTVGATVPFTCEANIEQTERTATVTLTYTYNETSISATAVVTQAALIVDYATMPFAYDGNGTGTLPNGLTATGLGTYSSSPKMKFDGAEDNLILKLNAAPVSIIYDIKGNGSGQTPWAGTFKVQVSADGTEYEDLKVYENNLGDVQTDTIINNITNNTDVRYIKWIYTEKTTGNVALGNIQVYDVEFIYVGSTTLNDLTIGNNQAYVVKNGKVLTLTGTVNNPNPDHLIIQEGGQLIHTSPVEATIQKGISAHSAPSKSGDGWYLIASPVDGVSTSGLITDPVTSYDLYKYDEPSGWWYSNHGEASPFNTLECGKGYLYANANNIDLDFAGLMIGTDDEVTKTLSFACTEYPELKGYNLMGNPFTRNLGEGNITLGGDDVTSVLLLNNDSEYQTCNFLDGDVIKPGQGFFIQATDGDKLELKFKPSSTKDANEIGLISIKAGDESYIDKAYIQFDGGNTLRKMTLTGDKSQVYVMHHYEDYAAARLYSTTGSVPVNFEAAAEGTYTITVEAKNLDLETLRLIDNFTGEEIDLLVEPTYTFKANSDEPAERFTLLFEKSTLGIDENDVENEVFAYQNGSDIVVNGEGTLQVFDVMGRFVMSREINGNDHINTSLFNTGVYVFRLNGETVMTQKIVIR